MASPTWLEAEAAQLYAYEFFRSHFRNRFPQGVVLQELDYLGATTIAPAEPGGIEFTGKPEVNRVLAALASDFRRHLRERDYRKPDGLGLSGDALCGELLEVTTVKRTEAAATQLRDKLDTLKRTVNAISGIATWWSATGWRPVSPTQLFLPLPAAATGARRILSFEPTYRYAAPPGIILYEILEFDVHRPLEVPLKVPEAVRTRLRAEKANFAAETADAWARQFVVEHPVNAAIIRGLAVVAGFALAVAALLLFFDPIPGDEVACTAAAVALLHYAVHGTTPVRKSSPGGA